MQRLWYYTIRGEQRGPIPEDDFRARVQAGEIASTDLAWTDGMTDWAPVGSRPELRVPETPPAALPSTTSTQEVVPSGAAAPDFGPWLTIVGVSNILLGALLTMTCIGIPVGILMIIAGAAAMSAKTALQAARSISPEVAAALAKFRTYFLLTGVVFLLNIVGFLLIFINASGMALALSRMAEQFQ